MKPARLNKLGDVTCPDCGARIICPEKTRVVAGAVTCPIRFCGSDFCVDDVLAEEANRLASGWVPDEGDVEVVIDMLLNEDVGVDEAVDLLKDSHG